MFEEFMLGWYYFSKGLAILWPYFFIAGIGFVCGAELVGRLFTK